MKHIYYDAGPATLFAGIAGKFNLGQAKPVSDKAAALLLGRKDIEFREATAETPLDKSFDLAALEAEVLAMDQADAEEAAAAANAAAAPEAKPAKGKKGQADQTQEGGGVNAG